MCACVVRVRVRACVCVCVFVCMCQLACCTFAAVHTMFVAIHKHAWVKLYCGLCNMCLSVNLFVNAPER